MIAEIAANAEIVDFNHGDHVAITRDRGDLP